MTAGPMSFEIVVFLIVLALAFDFMNGFHDAANSIATVVSTRVLRPHYAVAWAAFFNFIAFLFFGLSVANTIGNGVDRPGDRRRERDPRRADRRDRLERDHLVVRPAVVVVARADRRPRRSRGREGRRPCARRQRLPQDQPRDRALADARLHARGAADDGRRLDVLRARRRTASTAGSGGSSSSPPRSTASATAATTPRRRWASSR